MTARRGVCRWCGRRIALTPTGRIWAHGAPRCPGTGRGPIPRRTPPGIVPDRVPAHRRYGRRIRTVRVVGGLL